MNDIVHGDEIDHLKGRAGDGAHRYVDNDEVVKFQWLAVLNANFEHRHVNPFGTNFVVRVTDVAKIRNTRFLEVRQVPAVVHDPHCVGLCETNANGVLKFVVSGLR